jgi:serine/threonine protein kinase
MGAFGVVREVTKIHLEDGVEQPPPADENAAAAAVVHNHHYDISTARDRMVQQYMRQGEARYAVKYLRTQDVSVEERARGRVDLAIEIKYLHALNHPNIVKMRGYFETDGDDVHASNFFLMDRLYGTLEDRIGEWAAFLKEHTPKGVMGLLSKLKRKAHDALCENMLQDRIVVAYDIASAFRYMHSHKLIYR